MTKKEITKFAKMMIDDADNIQPEFKQSTAGWARTLRGYGESLMKLANAKKGE